MKKQDIQDNAYLGKAYFDQETATNELMLEYDNRHI
jgi:hypothetical protein